MTTITVDCPDCNPKGRCPEHQREVAGLWMDSRMARMEEDDASSSG